MHFIQYWIERCMENPADRERNMRDYVRTVKENAEKLKAKWESEATKTPGFWNFPENTAQARARVADAKVNPISVYARAVKEIDEKNIRDKSQK